MGRSSGRIWLSLLCIALLGYALFGKGWAYVGYPPLFVGELVLLLGAIAALSSGAWRQAFAMLPAWCLLALMAWGLCRTLPYVSKYGFDSLRDAVIWGYGAFAYVVFACLVADPSRLRLLLHRYRQFTWIFVLGIPIVWLVCYALADSMPHWPWADAVILDAKAGDAMVHLAGILAFWALGLGGEIGLFRLLTLASCVALMGAYERAGLLAFLVIFALCLLARPRDRSLHRLIVMGLLGLLLLAAADVRFVVPAPKGGKERELSIRYLVANLLSIGSDTQTGDLDDTKQWRLDWWNQIFDYTLHGPYFWQGKGFGINLADDDGFQVMKDHSLRSPHNAHLTLLARAGAPGLALWVLVQLTWAGSVLACLLSSHRERDQRWTALFIFLLAYWLAFIINASFDVFIEGPMGGIWFWTLYGAGLATTWIYQHDSEMLDLDG